MLKRWFGKEDDLGDEHLETFNSLVHAPWTSWGRCETSRRGHSEDMGQVDSVEGKTPHCSGKNAYRRRGHLRTSECLLEGHYDV